MQLPSRGQNSLRLARSSCVGMHPPAAGNEHLARISAALLRSSTGAAMPPRGANLGRLSSMQRSSSAGVA